MIFNPGHKEAFVWFYMPGAAEPVVCGKVAADNGTHASIHRFIYGRSYRELQDAVPLLPHALPINANEQSTRRGLHGVLRDAAPDAWGRRVLMYKLYMSVERGEEELTEIDYLMTGGQGIGALHFQDSEKIFEPKPQHMAELGDLMRAAEAVEKNVPLPPDLEEALLYGTSIGGARPKALIKKEDAQLVIAKFSSSTDIYPMVRLEAMSMALAGLVGIDTVTTEFKTVMDKDVLLVNRFDCDAGEPQRRHFFSALTALELVDEMEARYASYPELADYLRRYSEEPVNQCRELYRRMLFNIFIGNTDDHARNHAMFWNGRFVSLTPAYDVCVMPRSALASRQAMDVGEQGKQASLANALSSCGHFGLTEIEANQMADDIEAGIHEHWQNAYAAVELPKQLANSLWQRTVLSPAIREN